VCRKDPLEAELRKEEVYPIQTHIKILKKHGVWDAKGWN
jgi:hypothetical protein